MKFQIIQNDFTSRALRKEVGQVSFRRQPLFLQYLLRVFGILCFALSIFCLVTVGMVLANPGLSSGKNALVDLIAAAFFIVLGLRYTNITPQLHGKFLLRDTFARRTDFRSDGFSDYRGERHVDYQYRDLGEIWEGKEAFYLFVTPRKFLILQKKDFAEGEVKSFRIFLQKKTNRTVRELRVSKVKA